MNVNIDIDQLAEKLGTTAEHVVSVFAESAWVALLTPAPDILAGLACSWASWKSWQQMKKCHEGEDAGALYASLAGVTALIALIILSIGGEHLIEGLRAVLYPERYGIEQVLQLLRGGK